MTEINPQLENGYLQFATEIMDAFCKIRINGEARQVLDFIIRKTYGFHKKMDCISLGQFALATGLKRHTVVRALGKLLTMNLIKKTVTQKGNSEYGFIKQYDLWKPLPKKVTVTQKGNSLEPKKVIGVLPKKEHTKDNNTKDIYKDTISGEIQPDKLSIPNSGYLEPKKPKELTIIQKLVLVYKQAKGFKVNDKHWDITNFKRCSKSAKLLSDGFENNFDLAKECIYSMADEFNNKNLDFTFETIVKHCQDWRLKNERQQ